MAELQRTEHGIEGLWGHRYGEMLLATLEGSTAVAEVYTTFMLNDCPDEAWQAIDADKVAADQGCDFALKNGPRYWLIDSIERGTAGEFVLAEIGGLAMARIASVRIDLATQVRPEGLAGGPMAYRRVRVDRKARFGFEPGRTVYELVDPDGDVFVMQAYCVAADPDLDELALAGLGDRLALPDGWRFVVRTLDVPLAVGSTDEDAVVVQDELQNTYCRHAR